MRRPPTFRRGLFALLAGVLLAGCGGGDAAGVNTPSPPSEVRHDLQPLTSRFPALRQPAALPDAPFLTSAELDLAFTTPEHATSAYLDPMTDSLVLMSTGM